MPLTKKGKKIMSSMKKEYGDKAEQVFYASRNAGKIKGVDKSSRLAAQRRALHKSS